MRASQQTEHRHRGVDVESRRKTNHHQQRRQLRASRYRRNDEISEHRVTLTYYGARFALAFHDGFYAQILLGRPAPPDKATIL